MSKLYYIHDPMCSWCYAFRPVLGQLLDRLPNEISLVRLLGGLAADTDEIMSQDVQQYVQSHWHRIEERVPGTRFNFDFWQQNQPKRSTYPACRAVIAAREQGASYDHQMTEAIQDAYYLQAKNPSDDLQLIEIATELGLDKKRFELDLSSTETQVVLEKEIQLARQLDVMGFPTLLLSTVLETVRISIDYERPDDILRQIETVSARVDWP